MVERLNYGNRFATTLAAGINDTDVSLEVADTTGVPDTPFLITIDAEIIKVGAVDEATNILSSLTRGQEGTVAASHDIHAAVENRITKGTLEQLAITVDGGVTVQNSELLENEDIEGVRGKDDTPLKAEVVSSFPTRANGHIIYHTGEDSFFGRVDGEWV